MVEYINARSAYPPGLTRNDNCWALTQCCMDSNCPGYLKCKLGRSARYGKGAPVNGDDIEEAWERRAAILNRANEIVDEMFDGFIVPASERVNHVMRIAMWLAEE